jgi:hypothetical protein
MNVHENRDKIILWWKCVYEMTLLHFFTLPFSTQFIDQILLLYGDAFSKGIL